jgi:uncharacterized protein (TIGR03435 family)
MGGRWMRAGWARVAAVAAITICACGAVRAQDAAGDKQAKPAMMPKSADPDWEVVTVKPSDPNAKSDHLDASGRHVVFENEPVENLLWFGYHVQKNQIANAPEWVKTERWDVDGLADVDGEPNVAQLQALARKVLAERFGLKLHREQREMPVFALRAAKGGPKLMVNTSDPNGQPNEHRKAAGAGWHMYAFTNTSMPVFVLDILGSVDRPILDQTGLKGRYDFQLKWLTDESHSMDPDAPPGLFTAIQEQLGLKLEAVKAPVDVMVIDKVERPGAN